jgi:NCS1 family nucleobase:cation symporter-1
MALNISDFSRFAKTQRAQAAGHAFGLVGFMTIFSVVAIAATSVARGVPAIRGDPSDPIALLASTAFSPIARLLAAFGVLAATLSTNIAANVVAPANAFLALGFFRETGAGDESRFRSASRLVAALGTVIAPWRLLRDAEGFVWVWLVGHAAVLAPVAGVFLAEYHVVRKRKLDIDGLYDDTDPSGPYWYADGVNVRAMVAFGVGALLCLPGFLDACGVGALWTAADGNGGAAAAAVARRVVGACYE